MKSLLFVLMILALPIAALAGSHQHVYVTFESLRGADPAQHYTMAVIRAVPRDHHVPVSNQQLAETLLDRANNWTVDVYRERYEPEKAAKWEEMRQQGIYLTENSSFVMILDKTDPYKILGTLWTAYPDDEGKLDLERSTNWVYPRAPIKEAPYPMLEPKDNELVVGHGAISAQGGVVEFKRLVLNPASPRELMPAMLIRGETHDHLNTQPIMINDRLGVLPAEFALRCKRELVPIYLRFGFKMKVAEPIPGDYIMAIDRINYVENAKKWFDKARANGWNLSFDPQPLSESVKIEHRVRTDLQQQVYRTCRRLFAS